MVNSWNALAAQSPLATTDWSGYFNEQVPSTGWWNEVRSPYSYEQGTKIGESFDYDPGGFGEPYTPTSALTSKIFSAQYDEWFAREFPELTDFTADWQQGGVADVGTVDRSGGFGQFANYPGVYDEIESAAKKHGVPSNFLMAIIAAESQGDWQGDGYRTWGGRPQSGPLLPYIGVFQDTAVSRAGMSPGQFQALLGDRPGQIDLLARVLRSQYEELQSRNPQWGWSNVASYHYSGKPDPNAELWYDESDNGSNLAYMNKIVNWWKGLDEKAGNTWSNYTSTNQMTGIASPNKQEWAAVNQWDPIVAGAAQQYGVPANLIKAIIRMESKGDANAESPQGATGLMQVMPFHTGGDQSVLWDAETNIDVGTRILMDNYRQWGSWELAAKAYLAGNPYSTAMDAHETTVGIYWRKVKTYWDELNAEGSGLYGAPAGDPGPMLQVNAIFPGGTIPPISQGMQYSSNGMYGYGTDYGLDGVTHTGIDYVMPVGTPLYSPVGGTVTRIDNTYFDDYSGSGPLRGEIRILLDNGHELIFGHMNSANVRVGDRITPGTQVGLSGKYVTDQTGHLHLEYRIPDESMRSGWRIVDPAKALGGQFAGTHQSMRTGLGYNQTLTFQALMRAGASGAAIPDGPVYSMGGGRSGWNSWLRDAMAGRIRNTTHKPTYTYRSTFGSNSAPITPEDVTNPTIGT